MLSTSTRAFIVKIIIHCQYYSYKYIHTSTDKYSSYGLETPPFRNPTTETFILFIWCQQNLKLLQHASNIPKRWVVRDIKSNDAQKMKISIKYFFSKCDQSARNSVFGPIC